MEFRICKGIQLMIIKELTRLAEKLISLSAVLAFSSSIDIHEKCNNNSIHSTSLFSRISNEISEKGNKKIIYVLTPQRTREFKSDYFDIKFIARKKELISSPKYFKLIFKDHEFIKIRACKALESDSSAYSETKSLVLPVSNYEKTLVDCLEKPMYGPGIKSIIHKIHETDTEEIIKIMDNAFKLSTKAALKRLCWIIDTLFSAENSAESSNTGLCKEKIDSILKKAEKKLGQGFSLLDPGLPDSGEYSQRWKLRINLIDSAEKQLKFPDRSDKKNYESEKYIFFFKKPGDTYLENESLIRKIRTSTASAVLIKSPSGTGKTSLAAYLHYHFFPGAAVIRIRPEHRVFINFTRDLVKCILFSGLLNNTVMPDHKELLNPLKIGVKIRKILLNIQALNEKKSKKNLKYNRQNQTRALIIDNMDILPFENKNFSEFFEALFLPDMPPIKVLCISDSKTPPVFLRLDAEQDLQIVSKNDMEFTEDHKKKFLKNLLNSEPAALTSEKIFSKTQGFPGLIKHICLDKNVSTPGHLLGVIESMPPDSPVLWDYIVSVLSEKYSPPELDILKHILVIEFITPPVLDLALNMLCKKRSPEKNFWPLVESVPFAQRISSSVIKISPLVYKAFSAALEIELFKEFNAFMRETGIIYSRRARLVKASERIIWAQRAMSCFQRTESNDKCIELIRIYGDSLLKEGRTDILEMWLDPLSKTSTLNTYVCYYMGILSRKKSRELALSWLKKAENCEMALSDEKQNSSILAMALILQGQLIRDLDFQAAADIYDRVIALSDKIDDSYTKAVVKGSIGAFYESSRDDEMALAFYRSSLDDLKLINEPSVEATVLNNIGLLLSRTNKINESIKCYGEAIELYGRSDNQRAKSSTLFNLAHHHQIRGEYLKAASYLNECYDIRMSLHLNDQAAESLISTAHIHLMTNNFALSLKLSSMFDDQNLSNEPRLSLSLLKGYTASHYLDFISAQEFSKESSELIKNILGNPAGYEWTLLRLKARIFFLQGNYGEAETILLSLQNNEQIMKSPYRSAQVSIFLLSLKLLSDKSLSSNDLKELYDAAAPLINEGLVLDPAPEYLPLLLKIESFTNAAPIKDIKKNFSGHLKKFLNHLLSSFDKKVLENFIRTIQKNRPAFIVKSNLITFKKHKYRVISKFINLPASELEAADLRSRMEGFDLFMDREKMICREKRLGLIPLEKKVILFNLLEYLVSAGGDALGIEEIYRKIWENEFYGTEDRQNVMMAVSRLRSLIEPAQNNITYIVLTKKQNRTAYRFNSSTKYCLITNNTDL
jgi:tetratricopeptide (TPR) repeat protein